MPAHHHWSSGGSGGFYIKQTPKLWIYVVIHELYENLEVLRPFITLVENFGLSLENDAHVIIPQKNAYLVSRQDILSLKWNNSIYFSLAQKKSPYFLVLPCDISAFKPKLDNHVIVEFPNPTTDLNRHFDILFDLAQEIKTKKSISEWKYIQAAQATTEGLISHVINTKGGAVVKRDVNISSGDFVGHDQIITEINIYLHPNIKKSTHTRRGRNSLGNTST